MSVMAPPQRKHRGFSFSMANNGLELKGIFLETGAPLLLT
jgi:hypothetical protein